MAGPMMRWLGGLIGLLLLMTPLACSADPQYGLQSSPDTAMTLRSGKPKPKLRDKPQRPPAATARTEFAPFFDNRTQREKLRFPRDEAVDATPPLPKLKKFDRQVLAICGEFGSRVDRSDVQRLFEQNPGVVKQIARAVDGEIFEGRQGKAKFLDDLVQIWTRNYGFEHIFCGDVKAGEIGGLHYVGRYAQLQQQGVAGRLENNQRREEVQPGEVYTIGVKAQVNGRIIRDDRKGYAYVTDAAEMLLDGTVAFKRFSVGRSRGTKDCLYRVDDADADQPFEMVFVKTAEGIVTMYPDATPRRSGARC